MSPSPHPFLHLPTPPHAPRPYLTHTHRKRVNAQPSPQVNQEGATPEAEDPVVSSLRESFKATGF
jgi:hypothetical protein